MEKPNQRIGIMDLPENERPRERLAQRGENALSIRELLAILLRVGVEGMSAVDLGEKLLNEFEGLRGLHAASFEELCAVKGMGPAKAAQIKAAIELGYRLQQESEASKPQFSNPNDVNVFMHHLLAEKTREELWVLALNTRNQLLQKQQLYKGTINHSSARMAEIMEIPIRARAAAIILVHNHPSGDPKPSAEDIRFTEDLVRAGQLMDIGVLDHIIIGKNGFKSIRKLGQVSFKSSPGKHWY
ncbi:MAG: DNA repair protein RadC [Anaerolineaceae bacterium]|nr:DNA repair protein RadC [Anaerolineaceae bacterium]